MASRYAQFTRTGKGKLSGIHAYFPAFWRGTGLWKKTNLSKHWLRNLVGADYRPEMLKGFGFLSFYWPSLIGIPAVVPTSAPVIPQQYPLPFGIRELLPMSSRWALDPFY
uniref:Uncharacterized protein n=2 Tax=Micrurus TaxID=8634 RepID=A0A2D4FQ63_MICCO